MRAKVAMAVKARALKVGDQLLVYAERAGYQAITAIDGPDATSTGYTIFFGDDDRYLKPSDRVVVLR